MNADPQDSGDARERADRMNSPLEAVPGRTWRPAGAWTVDTANVRPPNTLREYRADGRSSTPSASRTAAVHCRGVGFKERAVD